MNYFIKDRSIADRLGYQGHIKIKYSELCQIFGQPEILSGDDKVQSQWTLEVLGSVLITIYDYKENVPSRDVLQWHIGGKTPDVVQLIELIIKERRKALK